MIFVVAVSATWLWFACVLAHCFVDFCGQCLLTVNWQKLIFLDLFCSGTLMQARACECVLGGSLDTMC